MPNRVEGLAHRWNRRRVERIFLGLDRPALAGVRPAGEALGHEAADIDVARGCEQRVGAFGAEAVGLRKRLVGVLEVGQAAERGRLVDDRFGSDGRHGLLHGARVEQVEHDRLGAQGSQAVGLRRRAGAADDVVAALDELRDEA